MATKLPYPRDGSFTIEMIQEYDKEIARVAAHYGLDTYPNQMEIITSKQMLDAYATIGMPIFYRHWSFEKRYARDAKKYSSGQMGLAYEIVINSDPCIAYLMEGNTMMMQALVVAHACYGHNSFFKGNYLFRQNTDAEAIIDYLEYARNYITRTEELYGKKRVEELLDAAHSLQHLSVNRYRHPAKLSKEKERKRTLERAEFREKHYNELWSDAEVLHVAIRDKELAERKRLGYLDEPQENILYFVEKYSPNLEEWQREILRIVRKIAQYFYPQRQTQVMNEGWATFWHYTILQHLYDEGKLEDGFMLEFLISHTAVTKQPAYNSPHFSGINPYAIGFNMYTDIRRICENPTAEDREWFPDIAGTPWLPVLHEAMQGYKDESFIRQYLSPHLMRHMKLFALYDTEDFDEYYVSTIHDETGYRNVRNYLSDQHNLSLVDPDIQIVRAEMRSSRNLTLRYKPTNRRELSKFDAQSTLNHLHHLWGFPIVLEVEDVETGVTTPSMYSPRK